MTSTPTAGRTATTGPLSAYMNDLVMFEGRQTTRRDAMALTRFRWMMTAPARKGEPTALYAAIRLPAILPTDIICLPAPS